MSNEITEQEIANYLLTATSIRERCLQVLNLVERNEGKLFRINRSKLSEAADYVISHIKDQYPTLEIPYHSRWRHIETGGVNRSKEVISHTKDKLEIGRIKYDLIIPSILLDAGAGPDWSYNENGTTYARSEGLGVASVHMFLNGVFSHDSSYPKQTTSEGLSNLTSSDVAKGMQVSASNPLIGVEGRTALLNELGKSVSSQPDIFGKSRRLGLFFDHLYAKSIDNSIEASDVLEEVLRTFGSIWPSRANLGGINLGDTWSYEGVFGKSESDQFIPFHKLSQWLTYSLFEPLEEAGIAVHNLDKMTGLPEYRNGGFFVDSGVLEFKETPENNLKFSPDSPEIVEWRALTVCLLDLIAEEIRKKLPEAENWPLAKILEGGTWSAGRKIAKSLRADGSPPINIESDGTVF